MKICLIEYELQELEKVKNFDWDEWRKSFLKHNNNKKSRVTDLLRKLDEDGDGNLTRLKIFIMTSLGVQLQSAFKFLDLIIEFTRSPKPLNLFKRENIWIVWFHTFRGIQVAFG
jgi:hypothetical protein